MAARSRRCSSTATTGYEIVALGAIFLFGWLLERRHGRWAPLLVFLVGGAGGMALVGRGRRRRRSRSAATAPRSALLGAWSMRDLLGRRRGREDDADLLGVLAIAVVLVLLPARRPERATRSPASPAASIGLLLGLLLARLRER